MNLRHGTTLPILCLLIVADTPTRPFDGVAAFSTLTEQVSVSSAGEGGNGNSSGAAISADGRIVAFVSAASNLDAGDLDQTLDVYVRDRDAGTTTRVPLPAGTTVPIGPVSMSADGRLVAFAANGPEPDVLNIITHVYLHDRVTGVTQQISTTPDNHRGSSLPVLSDDGRFVAYLSMTADPSDPDGVLDVLVFNRETGSTSFANTTSAGVRISAPFDPDLAVDISGDGRIVAFTFGAALVAGAPGGQVFVHDMFGGATSIASTDTTGAPSEGGHFFRPAVSTDGRFVAFYSASALVPADTNGMPDTYVRDLVAQTVERASVDSGGNQVPQGSNLADNPAISADGRFVAFASIAPDLAPGDTNENYDVYVRDRLEGTTTRVSVSTSGAQANGISFGPALSADGRAIAFTSVATNLSPAKNPAVAQDVYVREEGATPAPPVLSQITPSTSQLWPPDGKFVDVMLAYTVTADGSQPLCEATVASNQVDGGQWEVVDAHHVRLRAQHSGQSARVYTIAVRCVDEAGQSVSGSTQVTVPHDRR